MQESDKKDIILNAPPFAGEKSTSNMFPDRIYWGNTGYMYYVTIAVTSTWKCQHCNTERHKDFTKVYKCLSEDKYYCSSQGPSTLKL